MPGICVLCVLKSAARKPDVIHDREAGKVKPGKHERHSGAFVFGITTLALDQEQRKDQRNEPGQGRLEGIETFDGGYGLSIARQTLEG